jgi:alpha-tubulin suppressor-like RCC1 family protein
VLAGPELAREPGYFWSGSPAGPKIHPAPADRRGDPGLAREPGYSLRLYLALLLAGAVGCGGRPRSGTADGGADAPVSADATEATPLVCRSDRDCGSGRFCNLPGGTCVSAVVAVAAGSVHTCAVHRDGRVSCWGHSPFIVPGLPVVTWPVFIDLPGPASSVVLGIQAACALLRAGTVHCWGDLGQGAERPAPVVQETGEPLSGVRQIAGGSSAFCGITAAGTSCWGGNAASELARPPSPSFPARTAVLAQAGPRRLLAATVAIVVHDGASELCGWGNNDSGIVPGPRGIVERPGCVQMVPVVAQLSAGDGHICARRGGDRFSCWGSNSGGQLGTGDEGLLEAPLPGTVRALPAAIDAIESGAYHTCALLETGKVLCWGSNEHGECGLPPSAPRFGPSEAVAFPLPVTAIGSGAGAQHSCAVLTDGSVQCWGYDNEGQLGSGVLTRDPDRSSALPLPVRW